MTEPSTEAASGAKKKHSPPPGHVPHDDHDDHGHHEHPFLAHHFDTPQQQFEAGKLGIWLFLVTEVLFFAGLFCAYTIYRAQNPEVFVYAHYHLDTNMGAVNTTVLLFSSLTAAWAVRCAQLRQTRGLILNIVVTIACACTFMVVKYFEYSHKAHDGLLWGKHFKPVHEPWQLEVFKEKHPEAAELAERLAAKKKAGDVKAGGDTAPTGTATAGANPTTTAPTAPAPTAAAPTGTGPAAAAPADAAAAGATPEAAPAAEGAATAAADPAAEAPADPAAPAGETAAAAPAGQAGEPAAAQPGAKPPAPKPGAKPKKAAAKKPAAKPATAAAEAKEGTGAPTGEPSAEKLTGSEGLEPAHPEGMESASKDQAAAQEKRAENVGPGTAGTPPPAPGTAVVQDPAGLAVPVPNESIGKLDEKAVKPLVDAGILAPNSTDITRPRKAHVFFGIYFFMTGLHGVHVLIGIGIWIWMLFKARTGVFNENYFGPIDYTALYWHLVDLIWIYLFPLLYLIH